MSFECPGLAGHSFFVALWMLPRTLPLCFQPLVLDVFFFSFECSCDKVKLGPLCFNLRPKNPMGVFATVSNFGSTCGTLIVAPDVDLSTKQVPGLVQAVWAARHSTRLFVLARSRSECPGTNNMARDPPLFNVTLRVAYFWPITVH